MGQTSCTFMELKKVPKSRSVDTLRTAYCKVTPKKLTIQIREYVQSKNKIIARQFLNLSVHRLYRFLNEGDFPHHQKMIEPLPSGPWHT